MRKSISLRSETGTDASLVGANIAHQLKKKISYRRVVNKTIQSR